MVTLIMGQTLVFWSGMLAGLSFVLLMVTCNFIKSCMGRVCGQERASRLHRMHKYFVYSTIAAVAAHTALAMLSSIGVWI